MLMTLSVLLSHDDSLAKVLRYSLRSEYFGFVERVMSIGQRGGCIYGWSILKL